MILKQIPEDFQVEELTDVTTGEGPFSFYRLEKSGWATPDALQAIRRRWQLDQRRLSYGGLKDRHAETIQYFTVFHGPQRRMTHQGFTVTYLGQVAEPYGSEHIRANHFQLILRDVSKEERAVFAAAFEDLRQCGVPNYFDDQRFGSVEGAGPFLAKSIILGRYEEALQLALTAYYPHDRGPHPEKGTAVSVFFPVAEAAPAVARVQEPSLPAARVRAGLPDSSILLVDDDPLILHSLGRILNVAGYRVTVTSGGEEALARFAAPDAAFDLVISDVVMPGMDGFELTRRLLALDDRARVLYISSLAHIPAAADRELIERFGLLGKPFGMPAVLQRVEAALAENRSEPGIASASASASRKGECP